jgi:hypothetical protein
LEIKMQVKNTKCFIRTLDDGKYFAYCIDMDLGLVADSFDEAKSALEISMIKTVIEIINIDSLPFGKEFNVRFNYIAMLFGFKFNRLIFTLNKIVRFNHVLPQ